MTQISRLESDGSLVLFSIALKLQSMISVTNNGLSLIVAPINCSREGCRHFEAMSTSLSNKCLLHCIRRVNFIKHFFHSDIAATKFSLKNSTPRSSSELLSCHLNFSFFNDPVMWNFTLMVRKMSPSLLLLCFY